MLVEIFAAWDNDIYWEYMKKLLILDEQLLYPLKEVEIQRT